MVGPRTLLLLVALLVPSAASARTLVDAGLAAVEADLSSTPDCTVGLDEELCVASWDAGSSLLPGDDHVAVVKFVDEVRVVARPPILGPKDLVVEPSSLVVEHPAFGIVNQTWKQLNGTLPPEVRHHVTLESREMTMMPGVWGVWVVVHLPVEVPSFVLSYPLSKVHVGVLCWDLSCGAITTGSYLVSDEDSLHVAKDNVLLAPWDTDAYLAETLGAGQHGAFGCQPWMAATLCADLARAATAVAPALGVLATVTPTVTSGFQLHRAVVRVERPAAQGPPAPAGGAGAAVPGTEPTAGAFLPSDGPGGVVPLDVPAPGRGGAGLPRPEGLARSAPAAGAAQAWSLSHPGPGLAALATGAAAVLAWLLYHRITRQRALDQATRRRIHEAIATQPGIRVGSIANHLGLEHNSVKRHVHLLERLGMVHGVGDTQRRYFVAGATPRGDALAQFEVLATPATRAVYDFVAARGQADLGGIAAGLGLAKSTVSHGAKQLVRAGLLGRRRVGGRLWLSAAAAPGPAAPPLAAQPPTAPAAPAAGRRSAS